jgi:delta 1-pyrroline-5-carboxylate dehydrogenase
LWIGADRAEGDALISTDPGDPDRVVAVAPRWSDADAARAVAVAAAHAPRWAATPAAERAAALVRSAAWA